jgi:hypothetical protein
MPAHNPPSITDASGTAAWRPLAALVLLAAVAFGTLAAAHYARLGLTLSHYDARAHLVVARRVTDSLTPGWRQFGGLWLPLPHVLSLILVQSDWAFRSGYPVVAISVVALACGLAALSIYVGRRTGSRAAALVAPCIILANPNLLYLQSTPMTEPLLLGLAFMSLLAVDTWCARPTPRATAIAGTALAALALTRYEGWCMAVALVGLAGVRQWRRHTAGAMALAAHVAGAIIAFMLLSWASTGSFFVDTGFFVPDNPARHSIGAVAGQVVKGVRDLGGTALLLAAGVECVGACVGLFRREFDLLPLGLLATAALPAAAFYDGHPYRVRYMAPIVAVAGILAACAVARLPRGARALAAISLVAAVLVERPPFDAQAPMVLEAQWETPYRLQRAAVTQYLTQVYDGTPILASMGSLGHYMQETSRSGFTLANFLHEGNGDLWRVALTSPSAYVHWVLIEERAEGGDELAVRARQDQAFLRGFSRVADGGGLVLYRNVCLDDAPGCTAGAGVHVP